MLTREEVQLCRDALADKRDNMLEENPASGETDRALMGMR